MIVNLLKILSRFTEKIKIYTNAIDYHETVQVTHVVFEMKE